MIPSILLKARVEKLSNSQDNDDPENFIQDDTFIAEEEIMGMSLWFSVHIYFSLFFVFVSLFSK